jgi:hypothetical protein
MGTKTKTNYKFVGFDTYKEKKAALVEYEVKAQGGMPDSKFKMWIEPETGMTFKLEGGSQGGPGGGTMTMERVQ